MTFFCKNENLFLRGPFALSPRAAVLNSHRAKLVLVKNRRCGCPLWNKILTFALDICQLIYSGAHCVDRVLKRLCCLEVDTYIF